MTLHGDDEAVLRAVHHVAELHAKQQPGTLRRGLYRRTRLSSTQSRGAACVNCPLGRPDA